MFCFVFAVAKEPVLKLETVIRCPTLRTAEIRYVHFTWLVYPGCTAAAHEQKTFPLPAAF